MRQHKGLLASLVALFLLGAAFPARAADTDLTLWRFCVRNDGAGGDGYCQADPTMDNRSLADNRKFKSFVKGFTALLSPKYYAPSASLGWAGWNMGFEYTANKIPGGKAWDDAFEGVERVDAARQAFDPGQKSAHADSVLHTVQLHVRKGLPFSAELGATATYLVQSKMVAVGFEGKYAVLDGYKKLPDIALRMAYTHLFGAQDLDFDLLAWDLSLSKEFGVGGFMKIAPYTAYAISLGLARPHVVNSTFSADLTDRLLKLGNQKAVVHRWILGARFEASHLSLAPELAISSVKVYQFGFNLGTEF